MNIFYDTEALPVSGRNLENLDQRRMALWIIGEWVFVVKLFC